MLILYVHGMGGEKFIINVCEEQTEFKSFKIKQLKEKMINDKGLPMSAAHLSLIFAGKQLDDDKTFDDYQIKDKSTIMSVVRVPGGIMK
jgi:hypothetical protein